MTHLGFHPPLPPEICVIEHKASMNSVFISNLFLLKFLGEFGDGRGQKLTHSKALRNCIFTRLNVIVFLATIFCNTQKTHKTHTDKVDSRGVDPLGTPPKNHYLTKKSLFDKKIIKKVIFFAK